MCEFELSETKLNCSEASRTNEAIAEKQDEREGAIWQSRSQTKFTNPDRAQYNMIQWLFFALSAFILHIIFLAFMQWRALLINFPGADGLGLKFSGPDANTQWFMPMIFLAAFVTQFFIYTLSEKRKPQRSEVKYGIVGGITNGIGTFFLIWSTEVATPFENALLFPLFSIAIIIICNIWGQWLYKERVNWKANACCVMGLLIATFDWKILF